MAIREDDAPPAGPAAAHAPRLTHQPALDGLRGAAVAGVLLFHGGHLTGGYLGVDAFFVLSGFLITSLLLAEARADGSISLRAFWGRRARRLLPALAVVLAGVALYAVTLAKPDELATIRGDALATIGYVANWRAILTSHDYWALFRSPSPLDHTWSLAIEEQFYLAWPLLVVALVRRRTPRAAARRVLALSAGLAIASFVWALVLFDPADPSRVYYGTDTRIASILAGAALAALLAYRGPLRGGRARVALEAAALAALAGLAAAWTHLTGGSDTLYRGGLFACGLATALVIASAVHPNRGPVGRMLSVRPLRALGIVSYGVYLWHWPLYVVLDEERVHLGGWPLLGVRVAATLAVSVVSYRFVEKPIRHGHVGARWPAPRKVAVAFTVAAVLVAAVLASTVGGSTPRVVVADKIRAAPADPVQQVTARPGRRVRRAEADRPQRVLVVGNSIALYGADEGFKRIRTTPPLDVLNLGSIGCRLLPEETRARYPSGEMLPNQSRVCLDNWALAVRLFRPDVVVLLVSDATDAVHEIGGRWIAPCEPAYDSLLERDLHDQIRMLAANGARVVVGTAAYTGLPFKSVAWFMHDDCQNAIFRKVVRSEPSAVLADVFSWICPHLEEDCRSHLAGIVLRPDGVHFRDASARLLAAWVIDQAHRQGVFRRVRVLGPEAALVHAPPET